jgi:hypothetical protein
VRRSGLLDLGVLQEAVGRSTHQQCSLIHTLTDNGTAMERHKDDESPLSSDSEGEVQEATGPSVEEKSRRRVQNAKFETLSVTDILLPFLNDSDAVG